MSLIQEIQDYTVIGAVGATGQQFAGWTPTIGDLTARFGVGAVDAYYTFPATNLLNDQSANAYNLTGVNVTDADNTTGIMNTNYAVDLNGTDEYMTQATLWDTMPTAMTINTWVKMDDGTPATAMFLFDKQGSASNHRFAFYINTDGTNSYFTNVGGTTNQISATQFAGGDSGWYMLTFCQDTTNGKRMWVNGNLVNQNQTATTLPSGGTTTDMIIGVSTATAQYWDGKIAYMLFMDYVMTQADVDWLYSTRYAKPAVFPDNNYFIKAYSKPSSSGNPKQIEIIEVERDSSYIYRKGGNFASTDYLRLEGVR